MSMTASDDLDAELASDTREMLTFQLGSGAFAVNVRQVREVLDYKAIQPIANAPATLLGMIDVRGVGVPVVDLKRKLAMSPNESRDVDADTRIIVMEFQATGRLHTVAAIADAVHEVADFGEQSLEPAPEFGESWNHAFMSGLGRREGNFLTLLDIDRLFTADDALLPARAAA